MNEIYTDDEVYGYALGAYTFNELDELIRIPSYEMAVGLADYWHGNSMLRRSSI